MKNLIQTDWGSVEVDPEYGWVHVRIKEGAELIAARADVTGKHASETVELTESLVSAIHGDEHIYHIGLRVEQVKEKADATDKEG